MSDPKTWPRAVRVTVNDQPSWTPIKSVPYMAAFLGFCLALGLYRKARGRSDQ